MRCAPAASSPAYSPGAPGAVLMVDATDADAARRIAGEPPPAAAALIGIEIIELHPMPA